MITAIIELVIRFRWLVGCLVVALIGLSVYALRTVALDAIPDISDPQIIVYAKWPRSPLLIETEVTEPVVRALQGSPDVQSIRGTSHMGYSFIYVILQDASRRAIVRQFVQDRLNAIRAQLPPDANVTVGPNASSMGWIFQYALVDHEGTRDLRELRLLNESQIKPALQSAPGVAEVASVGGLEKQYQVKLFPPLLSERGISLKQVLGAVQGAFQETGGRTIEVTNREYQLRGSLDAASLEKLEFLVLGRDRAGEAVRLKDVGYLQSGYDLRRGIADLDGNGEVVGGIAIMEQGRNVLAVTNALRQKLEQLKPTLPAGIELVPTYDRAALIWETLTNFFQAIVYELIVVILVIGVALKNVRASVAPVVVLLLGTLFTALPLALFDQTVNLFSLAGLAIAIGEMADATIVIVENVTATLARSGRLSPTEKMRVIVHATATMTKPLLFSMLIIVTSFLPIFFLGEREGRLFNPLAYSKTFAMAFSTLLTLFLLPIVIVWIFKRDTTVPADIRESVFVRAYRAALLWMIRYRYAFVGASAVILVIATVVMFGFQKDYMPEMDEGSILYMPTTLPGLPSREAGWIVQQMDRKLKTFPEVARVFGKLGRADTATDPAPVEMIETTVMLKPRAEWRPGMTKDKLIDEMNKAMTIVGYSNSWTQPISTRVMMQDTGIQTPVGLKVKGKDLAVVQQVAQDAERLLRNVSGTASVIAERISQGYFVDARLDLEKMAQHGVTVDEALSTVRFAIGGDNLVGIRQEDKTVVPLSIQYSPEYIDTLAKVRNTPVVTEDGRSVPLGDVADVAVREAPEMIRNDNGELAGYIYVYLRDVTGPEYVERAREYLRTNLKIPSGYSMEWTGNYQYTEDARASLRIVVPITLAIMFILLMMAFNSVADSSLIMASAPFALVGGILLQAALGFSMTTAVIIGYVSLFAVAIQTGIIMIEFIREALANRTPEQSYMDAVVQGSVARLRPKLMTVATTVFGLLPIMFSSGSGMDITQPIATPTFGGMISSTIYVLFLIPCLFAIGEDIRRRRPEWFVRKAVPAVLVLFAVLAASCGGSQSASSSSSVQTGKAGDMTVTFLSAPDPPKSGDNSFLVTVKQPDGTPVADGQVKAVFSMPAMPSMNMPAMRSEAALSPQGGGTYSGTGQIGMSGTWNVEISVSRNGQDLGQREVQRRREMTGPTGRGFQVLVVDDSVLHLKILEHTLSREFASVHQAHNVREAMEIFERERPALVITDCVMPDSSGFELCQRIRAAQSSFVYIIMVTGMTEKENVVKGLAAGADDYLTKPFDTEELLARVKVGLRLIDLHRQLEDKNRLLEHFALTDALTGLPNRRAIEAWADRQLHAAVRHHFSFWVVLIDLDHFKRVNDTYGHDAGDIVLKAVAEILQAQTRSSDISGRIGGEEFIHVVTHAEEEHMPMIIERTRVKLTTRTFSFDGSVVTVTASLGVAGFRGNTVPAFGELVSRADRALYRAKQNGRNRAEFEPLSQS